MRRYDNRAWWLMLPAASILMFVGIIPLVTVLNYSFLDIFTLEQVYWVGVDWYREIVSSERFSATLGRSLLFSAVVLSVQIPLGVAIALALPRNGSLRIAILMLVAIPLVVPWNIIPMLWLDLINPQTGFAGRALVWLGAGFDYKFNALHTWIVLVVMDTWHWLGLVVVLAYAGLSGIPPTYKQAADIDGATALQFFRHVQLPKLGNVLSMVVLLRFIDSFMIYTEAFRINAGGPDAKTMFLSLDLGEEINAFNYGPAAARSILYFLMVLLVAWTFKTAMDRRRDDGAGLRA